MNVRSRRIQHRDDDDHWRGLSDNITAVAVLPDATVIVAGQFSGPGAFGEHLLGNMGSSGFVGRIDTEGHWLWVREIAAARFHASDAAGLDDGSAVFVGTISGAVRFGESRVIEGGMFVANISADGVWLWAGGVKGSFRRLAVTARAGGEIFVAGTISGYPFSPESGFVTKIDPRIIHSKGPPSYFWFRPKRTIVATGMLNVKAACSATDGGLFVVGSFQGTVEMDTHHLRSTKSESHDAFIAKLDVDLRCEWIEHIDVSSLLEESLAATDDGGAVVVGHLSRYDAVSFGAHELEGRGSSNSFIAKIDVGGTWQWASAFEAMFVNAAAAMPDGGFAVVGSTAGRAAFGDHAVAHAERFVYIARIDREGRWSSAEGFGVPASISLTVTAALPDGSALIAGALSGTAALGTHVVASARHSDAFLAKIDSVAGWAWATRGGGVVASGAYDVSVLPDGGSVVSGRFFHAAEFGAHGVSSGTPYTHEHFIARLGRDGSWLWAQGLGRGCESLTPSTTEEDGSFVAIGRFADTVAFAGHRVVAAPPPSDGDDSSDRDWFVAACNSGGEWQWAASVHGRCAWLQPHVGAEGAILLTGSYLGTVRCGPFIVEDRQPVAVQAPRQFAAALDALGAWQWAVDTMDDLVGNPLSLSDGGVVFTGGWWEGTSIQKFDARGASEWRHVVGADSVGEVKTVGASVGAEGGSESLTWIVQLHGASPLDEPGAFEDDSMMTAAIRLDTSGTWLWVSKERGALFIEDAMQVGEEVAVYGHFEGTIFDGSIATLTLEAIPNRYLQHFVARLGGEGSWRWASYAGCQAEFSIVRGLADGSVIVVGIDPGGRMRSLQPVPTLEETHASEEPYSFIGRLDDSGDWRWITFIDPRTKLSVVDVGDDGAATVIGKQSHGAARASEAHVHGDERVVIGEGKDSFIARVETDGTQRWAAELPVHFDEFVKHPEVATLGDGGALVTGHFIGTVTFGNHRLAGVAPFDTFIAKVDACGVWSWAVRAGGTLSLV